MAIAPATLKVEKAGRLGRHGMDQNFPNQTLGHASAQLLSIWHRLRQGAGGIPKRKDFEFKDFGAAIGSLFATELIEEPSPKLYVRLFGSELDTIFASNLTDRDVLETAPADQAASLLTIHRTVWASERPHVETDWPAVTPTDRVFKAHWTIVPVRRDTSDRPYFLGAVDPVEPASRPKGSRF